MNKINFLSLGFIFAGCFLGAGYLSGNELMQFFGDFGVFGIIGLFLSVLLIGFFGIMIIYISKETGAEKFEDVVFPHRNKIISYFFGVLQAILVFAIIVIMVAGAIQLIFDALKIKPYITGIVFCGVLALVACTGFGGLSKFFSLLVPLICLFAVIAAVVLISKNSFPTLPLGKDFYVNELLGNWFFAAITYLSYSIFSSVGVISPLATRQKNKNTYIYGVIFGTVLLIFIAIAILFSVFCVSGAKNTELPMFTAFCQVNKGAALIYAVLLFGGMFGTALTSLVSLGNYVMLKFDLTNKQKVLAIFLLSALSYFASLFGFDRLIGTVYPLFGYFGIIVLVFIFINFIKLKTKKS